MVATDYFNKSYYAIENRDWQRKVHCSEPRLVRPHIRALAPIWGSLVTGKKEHYLLKGPQTAGCVLIQTRSFYMLSNANVTPSIALRS